MTQPELFSPAPRPTSTPAWDDVDPTPVPEAELRLPVVERYGLTSQPGFAPKLAPLRPYGAPCLPSPTVPARLAANQAALTELTRAKPDPVVLRAYSGDGGLGTDNTDAYHTPAELAQLMWSLTTAALGRMPSRALEFSCGSGVFLGHAPERTQLVAVELDETSARIAKALHMHVCVHPMPFETYHTRSEDEAFDVVIGNPPFGPRGQTARLDRPEVVTAEQYFLRAALERTRPGGVCAVLVNAQLTLAPSHEAFRRQLLTFGQLVTAIAVPTTAFTPTGATVTTAILLFQRHDLGVQENLEVLLAHPEWKSLGLLSDFEQRFITGEALFRKKDDRWTLLGGYSDAHHLGTDAKVVTANRFGNPEFFAPLCLTEARVDTLLAQVEGAVRPLLTRQAVQQTARAVLGDDVYQQLRALPYAAHPLRDGLTSPDGAWVARNGRFEPVEVLHQPRVQGALVLAHTLLALMHATAQHRTAEARTLRVQLAEQERAYTRQFGPPDLQLLKQAAVKVPVLRGLVTAVQAGPLSQAVPEPQITRPRAQGSVAQIAASLAASHALTEHTLAEDARIPLLDAQEHLAAHYCFTGHSFIPPEDYYVGHAYAAAEHARTIAETARPFHRTLLLAQAAKFESLITPVSLADIHLAPRDPLIPLAALEAWVVDALDAWLKVHTWDARTRTSVSTPRPALSVERDHGVVKIRLREGLDQRKNLEARRAVDEAAVKALEAYLNYATKVRSVDAEPGTPEHRVGRAAAIREARMYEAQQEAHFRTWLLSSPFVEEIETRYTKARGATLRRTAAPLTLTLDGWAGPEHHPFQARDIRALANMQGALLDYAVGLGKTLTGLGTAAYLRQAGLARRPLLVVPLSVVGLWAMEIHRSLPSHKVLVVGMSPKLDRSGKPLPEVDDAGRIVRDEAGNPLPLWADDDSGTRAAKLARLATEAFDLVLMSRESFESLPMSESTRLDLITSDPQYDRDLELSARDTFDGRHRKATRFQTARQRKGFVQACLDRVNVAGPNDIPFEAFGFDLLIFDEVHSYKNLYDNPSLFGEVPRFLGGGGESNRALDAHHKARYVRAQGGRTFGLSATWVVNSPLEAHALFSLVSDDLPLYGLPHNAAFMDRFLRIQEEIVTNADGSVSMRPCVVGFRNYPELRALMRALVIHETAETCLMRDGKIGLPLPKAVHVTHTFDLTPAQVEVYATLRLKAKSPARKGQGHLFATLWQMRKIALDPVIGGLTGRNPRFDRAVEIALEAKSKGGKTLMFLDIGGAKGEDEGAHQRLKAALVRAGYPEQEILAVTASTIKGAPARLAVERRYARGDLTLLIGSGVMGTGLNLQRGTTDIVHLDLPWDPQNLKQRNGRGLRQGNTEAEVRLHVLLARGSFDALAWTIVQGKKGWVDQLFDEDILEGDNTGAGFRGEELALLVSDNPDEALEMIRNAKAAFQAATDEAERDLKLRDVRAYRELRLVLAERTARSLAREKGPSVQDRAGLQRLAVQLADARRKVDAHLASGFSLARVAFLKGRVDWVNGLPLHPGLTFQEGELRGTVEAVSALNVRVKVGNDVGSRTLAQMAHLTDLQPTTDPKAYVVPDATELVGPVRTPSSAVRATVPTPPQAEVVVHVLDPERTARLMPRDEGVVAIALFGQVPRRLPLREDALRSAVKSGATLILARVEGERVTAVILTRDIRAREATRAMAQDARLHQRVRSLLAA